MSAVQLSEIARDLIITQIKNNISSELAAIRADRNDNTVNTEPPAPNSYFIYDGALTYTCPCIFVVCDSGMIQDEQTKTNYLSANMKIFISAVVEAPHEHSVTIQAERYQAALVKILHQTEIVDAPSNVKIYVLVRRFTFSRLYTRSRKSENLGNFNKEVGLELEVRHWENPIT